MGLKGVIAPDHIPTNSYSLQIDGINQPILFTKVTGLDESLDVVNLPDRTKASGTRTIAGDCTVEVPLHHADQINLMDAWFEDSQGPQVAEDYKKNCTLVFTSLTGKITQTYLLFGVFVGRRKISDFEMDDEGKMATNEYQLHWDNIANVNDKKTVAS